MNKVEVGCVEAGLIQYLWLQAKTIINTWWWCKQNNVDCSKWYGVYAIGTEILVAQTGCTVQSEIDANILAAAINQGYKQ